MNSIFSGVSRCNEDATTELLSNLMRVTYVRDLILSFFEIDKCIIDTIKPDNISTQMSFDNVGRPDIVINAKDALIFIENKIKHDTDLQPSQTSTYLEQLIKSSKRYKKMIYLVPNKYKHILELEKASCGKVICNIKTWETLLGYLYEKELSNWSNIVEEALKHLSELVLNREATIRLSREEITFMLNPKDFIIANSFFIKAKSLIEIIDSKLMTMLGEDFNSSRLSWGENESEMGCYIRYKNKECIFYGFNLYLLQNDPGKSDYLFSLDISRDIANIELIKKSGFEIHEDEDWVYIKLDKYNITNFEDADALSNEIAEKIKFSI